jgi:folate-binding protein YgfZ
MTTKPAFAELPSRALIAVSGPDWKSFLQGLITQNVETLEPGEARFAGLLTPQGRLLWDMFVVGRAEGCWLDVAREHREAILQRLKMYKLRSKVELAADDADVSVLFPLGPPPGVEHLFVTDPRLPGLGFRSYGVGAPAGAEVADEAAYEAHRLSLGVPGPADWGSDATYPIEANFDLLGGIDFKKGCFVGQETTSRMKRRGQVKNRMLPIAFEGAAPAPGTEVLAGERRVGEVLSGMEGRAIALLRLDRIGGELAADGRPVRVERPAWLAEALGEGEAA